MKKQKSNIVAYIMLIIYFLLLQPPAVFTQQQKTIDSLRQVIKTAGHDTTRIAAYLLKNYLYRHAPACLNPVYLGKFPAYLNVQTCRGMSQRGMSQQWKIKKKYWKNHCSIGLVTVNRLSILPYLA